MDASGASPGRDWVIAGQGRRGCLEGVCAPPPAASPLSLSRRQGPGGGGARQPDGPAALRLHRRLPLERGLRLLPPQRRVRAGLRRPAPGYGLGACAVRAPQAGREAGPSGLWTAPGGARVASGQTPRQVLPNAFVRAMQGVSDPLLTTFASLRRSESRAPPGIFLTWKLTFFITNFKGWIRTSFPGNFKAVTLFKTFSEI